MSQEPLNPKTKDGRKRVLVVGAGAAGMSAAYHLSQHPDKFDVTLIDSADYCGGQAFSVPLDKDKHGASWYNQGVQGGSYIFHHTLTMFARQGYRADPVDLQVSFGKGDTFWTNVFPTELIARHQKEVKRLVFALRVMRWFEILFALLPLRLFFKLWMFSDEFTNTVALPMTALFLGTGNATPDVPAIMFERLCTSPTYGMWYPPDRLSIASNLPPMVVFPNLSEFYESWRQDLVSRGVTVRLSTELVSVISRSSAHAGGGGGGVTVSLHSHHSSSPVEETYDELILCCLADTAKRVLGATASFRERHVLGAARFADDLTVTHTDADYMRTHYQNFYADAPAVQHLSGVPQRSRSEFAQARFRPMYYTRTYDADRTKLELSFDTTHYQSQFPARVPFDRHVFQTIFLNRARDGALWTDAEIDPARILRADPWHQLCHATSHYLRVVPFMPLLQGRRHTRFAASWTLLNAHEVAVVSGLAAAVDLGATYPEDLEHDRFAFLVFRLYYLLAYGKWYRRRFRASRSERAVAGQSWASGGGPYGSRYRGPGVSEVERSCWKEEVKSGRSTGNLAPPAEGEEEEAADAEES